MSVIIALTGASGNMGKECLKQLLELEEVEKVKFLVRRTSRDKQFAAAVRRTYGKRAEAVWGDLADADSCKRLVADSDYVFHVGAIIPPLSDHDPEATRLADYVGTRNMVDAAVAMGDKEPKFVHISTVALYGHRNYLHPWGRVGDPLLPSMYDVYAEYKLKGGEICFGQSSPLLGGHPSDCDAALQHDEGQHERRVDVPHRHQRASRVVHRA